MNRLSPVAGTLGAFLGARRRTLGAFALSSCIAACSSPSSSTPASGSATVTGTVGGQTFTPASAIALKGAYDSAYPGIVEIILSDSANLCAFFQSHPGASKANLFELGFALGETNATSTVVPGTYTPSGQPNELDTAGWDRYGATCQHSTGPGTTAATVTLGSVGAAYVGTFDVTFNGGDHVTGSFNAPLCDLMQSDASAPSSADGGVTCVL